MVAYTVSLNLGINLNYWFPYSVHFIFRPVMSISHVSYFLSFKPSFTYQSMMLIGLVWFNYNRSDSKLTSLFLLFDWFVDLRENYYTDQRHTHFT